MTRGALKRLPLTFERGVLQELDASDVPNGFASRLENWEPLPVGGVRARHGWKMGPTSGGPASPTIAAVDFNDKWNRYISFHWTGTEWKPYATLLAADGTWGAFSLVGTITPKDTSLVADYRFLTTAGSRNNLYIGGRMLAKLWGIDGAGALTSSGAAAVPTFVRALGVHQNSLWAGGGKDVSGTLRPYRLMWTDPGADPLAAWPAANFIDVGTEDEDPITSLATHNDYLLIGRSASLWLLSGSPPNVNLHRLDEPVDVTQGNSIVSTPAGAIICGRRNVYLFDGAPVRRISEPVVEQYSGPRGADAAVFGTRVYILGRPVFADTTEGSKKIIVYDYVDKSWHVETVPERMTRLALAKGDASFPLHRMIMGPEIGVNAGALVHRYEGEIQQDRTVDDVGVPGWSETFTLKSPEYPPTEQATFRHLEIRFRQRQGNAAEDRPTITVHARQHDGTMKDHTYPVTLHYAGDEWVERLDLAGPAYGIQFEVNHTVPPGQGVLLDIVKVVLMYADDPGPR